MRRRFLGILRIGRLELVLGDVVGEDGIEIRVLQNLRLRQADALADDRIGIESRLFCRLLDDDHAHHLVDDARIGLLQREALLGLGRQCRIGDLHVRAMDQFAVDAGHDRVAAAACGGLRGLRTGRNGRGGKE